MIHVHHVALLASFTTFWRCWCWVSLTFSRSFGVRKSMPAAQEAVADWQRARELGTVDIVRNAFEAVADLPAPSLIIEVELEQSIGRPVRVPNCGRLA
ncbi:hypothetical protein [Devosia sp. RR2S18]|uniref:hypothetical protein n=1 Tax=Devosia rhizosphaerae TaxID=3049774 RepID=UPI0025410A8C|nr:hypothetical protein [Devosia sp. RR2S18]WIJ23845.1 hypothetical protein QOV41_12345 [Devosia sp. RR2S18]